MADTELVQAFRAPRIEVAVIPVDDGTLKDGPYEVWILLHLPDGKSPTCVLTDGGPWDRGESLMLIETIWTALGEKFAPTLCKGAQGLGGARQ